MTILAGVFSRNPSVRIPDSVCDTLKKNISRDPSDHPIEFRDAQAYFVKVDIGAFDRPAHRVAPTGSMAILAGEPLLTRDGPTGPGRDVHLAYLQTQWDERDFRSLRSASGTYCAAYFDPRTCTGHLVADRLGLRTLYYCVVDDFVYFATALRILEAIPQVPKVLDVLAVAEITGFGYPFGGGTAYADIKMLLPCEVLTIQQGDVKSTRYFHWDAIAPVQATEEEAMAETYRLFQSAVRRRLRGDKTTFAYLSGGLDSRCVVAALRADDLRVYTFNFSLANTQDQAFALEYANKSGTIHHELPTEPGPNWSAVMADAWRASPQRHEQMPEHPGVVWTGEGGSVGLGYVYVSPEIVSLLRSGNLDGAIDIYLRQQNKTILTRFLAPALAAQLSGHLHARLRQELDEIHCADPVRAFYIFLNLNGPRRHLVNHFNTIDQHRLEFQVPFYDSELLEYLTSIAVDPCLYHQFYVKWLGLFDPAVREVPWQAYPRHVTSPVPIPDNLPDQWNAPASRAHQAALDNDLLKRSAAMLSDADFPDQVLRKSSLRLMRLAWRLGLGNYAYALKAALSYYNYWKISGGKCELPASRATRHEQVGN
ncbi:MAG: hypothetical protein A3E79_13935 [Burkholderiales bacterium RIFCSPHIGHO2_12_FULL_61_11]|nr:MAG: hypothetical protein A3E79_13935 [Burkholderiales bacterium RIFCSPHIGHO2_12_FULL_61_11]